MNIQKKLFELEDKKYAEFQSRLIPTTKKEKIIGVRVPKLRKLAKEYINEPECTEFLKELPHNYYDENMLHGILISEIKEYDTCIQALNNFLPYVDNWAVCDIMSPKIFKRYRLKLIESIRIWSASKENYTCRFGIGMLMSHFLDDDFEEEYLIIPTQIHSEEYYVNMMKAWFFATALAKQWDITIKYIEEKRLDEWTHKKAIQKACESRRISDKQKIYLKSLKA